uniref:Uncharacterized protein n=1 Tax=Populus trichocarpa TaxID=3694 RepID=A9PGT5_POPTR|nr:unknown [Populus trichocarpa]
MVIDAQDSTQSRQSAQPCCSPTCTRDLTCSLLEWILRLNPSPSIPGRSKTTLRIFMRICLKNSASMVILRA